MMGMWTLRRRTGGVVFSKDASIIIGGRLILWLERPRHNPNLRFRLGR